MRWPTWASARRRGRTWPARWSWIVALEYTLQYLEETGHLEDTVLCLSADHYPYGLEQETLTELNGGEPVDMRFDVYHSTLILWCGSMTEPVHITKPCSSLDILPTLSNLFGLTYDSRLLMGRDILSDSEGLVVLSDRSFLTETGRYDAAKDTFTPVPGVTVRRGYVQVPPADPSTACSPTPA